MIERICSIENELSVQVFPPIAAPRSLLASALMDGIKLTCPSIHAETPEKGSRVYFRNGFCAYIDRPMHCVELALPECSSVYDAVACDRAGMYILEDAAFAAKKQLANIIRSENFLVYRNNVARPTAIDKEQEVAYGTHENYSVHEFELHEAIRKNEKQMREVTRFFKKTYDPTDPEIYASMLLFPFLITRQVICGAGSLLPYSGRYEISQRSRFFVNDIGSDSTSERSIAHIKKENHASGYHRLHIVCGDANMSMISNFLKLGSTRLVIRMIEENYVSPFFMQIPDSVITLHRISKDTSCSNLYQVFNDNETKIMSAVDVQRKYLELAEKFIDSHSHTPEDNYVLHLWKHVLDGLFENPESLVGVVDWVTKKKYLDALCERADISFKDSRLEDFELLYHALDRTLTKNYYAIEEKNKHWKIIDDDYVQRRRTEPPATRALARTMLAKSIKDSGKLVAGMDWEFLTSRHFGKDGKYEDIIYTLPDPFDSRPFDAEEPAEASS